MTDGIIQKVFDLPITQLSHRTSALYLHSSEVKALLEAMKQELIEEIKKTDRMFYDKTRYRIEKWLIGDNQE